MTRFICGTRDSVLCKTWLVFYVRHDSFDTTCDMTHFICETHTWRVATWAVTRLRCERWLVWCETCQTWLVWYVRHDSLICETDDSLTCETWLVWYVGHISRCYVRHDSFNMWEMTRLKCETWHIDMWDTWLVDMWDMTHWGVSRDSFNMLDMTQWYGRHMTPWHVRHDSFDMWDMTRLTCETWLV